MQWDTNLFEENEDWGIYALTSEDKNITYYVGIYKGDFEQTIYPRLIDNINNPEGTTLQIFQRLKPEERANIKILLLFSTMNIYKETKEEKFLYNTLLWLQYYLVVSRKSKYNNAPQNFNFRDASIPTNSYNGQDSKGERAIAQWLNRYNIPFTREYSYPDLTGQYESLRFDFKIKDKPIVIEFQGQQHYHNLKEFGDAACEKTREYDLLKREYCGKKGILLIEIPYNYKNLDMYLNLIFSIEKDYLV